MQIIAVGARHQVLVEEAAHAKLVMRLAETKGSMEFRPDLLHYYASYHGGLSEYKNRVWKRREGQDLTTHFKADEDLTPEELLARQAKCKHVFTTALAQRLVMLRLNRVTRYSPIDQINRAAKGPKADKRVLTHVKNRCGLDTGRKSNASATTVDSSIDGGKSSSARATQKTQPLPLTQPWL